MQKKSEKAALRHAPDSSDYTGEKGAAGSVSPRVRSPSVRRGATGKDGEGRRTPRKKRIIEKIARERFTYARCINIINENSETQ